MYMQTQKQVTAHRSVFCYKMIYGVMTENGIVGTYQQNGPLLFNVLDIQTI